VFFFFTGSVKFSGRAAVRAVASRPAAVAAERRAGAVGKYPLIDADMDICATHLNGCPLKLEELLAADDMNFAHDVFGIRRHIDRTTGELQDCFVPRYAAPTKKEVERDNHCRGMNASHAQA
jgi:hypothetical protein